MIKRHADSLGHAMDGLIWAVKTQVNYRIHIFLVVITIIGGFLCRVSYSEWLIIIIFIITGLIIETINTSIEQLGDAIDTNFNKHIKRAKDVSAAAMLLFALGALVVSSIIFIPKIVTLFG